MLKLPSSLKKKKNKRDTIFLLRQKNVLPMKRSCISSFCDGDVRRCAARAVRLKSIMRTGMLGRCKICVVVIRARYVSFSAGINNAWLHVNADLSHGCIHSAVYTDMHSVCTHARERERLRKYDGRPAMRL